MPVLRPSAHIYYGENEGEDETDQDAWWPGTGSSAMQLDAAAGASATARAGRASAPAADEAAAAAARRPAERSARGSVCVDGTAAASRPAHAFPVQPMRPAQVVDNMRVLRTGEIDERLWSALSPWQRANAQRRLELAKTKVSIARLVSGLQLEHAEHALQETAAAPLQRVRSAGAWASKKDCAKLGRAYTLVALKILSARDQASSLQPHRWGLLFNPSLLITTGCKDGFVHETAGATGQTVVPACSQRLRTARDAYYTKGVELRHLGCIYIVIQANGRGSTCGLPKWEGIGQNDEVMLRKLHGAGIYGWKLDSPVSVPLYRRKIADGPFEVFALMRVRRVIHTAFLAETLEGGVRMWYAGRIATPNAEDDVKKLFSACMLGEFILIRKPIVVDQHPQHVLATESGLSTLVMRGASSKRTKKKASARRGAPKDAPA